jgi:hypothetical protein
MDMGTTAQRVLINVAEVLAERFAQRYGSLKSVLSAGVVAFSKLTPVEREKTLDEANGIKYDDPSQQAAEDVRFVIKKWQIMNDKERAIALQFLSADESRAIREMLNALDPEIQAARRQKVRKSSKIA